MTITIIQSLIFIAIVDSFYKNLKVEEELAFSYATNEGFSKKRTSKYNELGDTFPSSFFMCILNQPLPLT